MNKIKNAMTLAEIMLVMFIIGIIATCLISVFNPKMTRTNAYHIRGTLYNLQKVNEQLLAENRAEGKWSLDESTNSGKDVYCLRFSDTVSTKGKIDCATTTENNNFLLTTGTSIKGLASAWQEGAADDSTKFKYKDIEFETEANVEKDANRKSKDQYRARIYKSEALVVPINDLDETKLIRYRVVGIFKDNVKRYKIAEATKGGVSFRCAASITGFAQKYGILLASACHLDAELCPRYFDCEIQLMDIPSYAGLFTVKKTY